MSSEQILRASLDTANERLGQGFIPFALTWRFRPLYRAPETLMRDLRERVDLSYTMLALKIAERPERDRYGQPRHHLQLPVLIASVAFPTADQRQRVGGTLPLADWDAAYGRLMPNGLVNGLPNGGLYAKGLLLVPPRTNLPRGVTLPQHVEDQQRYYVKPDSGVARLIVSPEIRPSGPALEDVLSDVIAGRVSDDDVLALPYRRWRGHLIEIRRGEPK